MFDIDGTLVKSFQFDEACFIDAVREVTGLEIERDWASYPHVTDTGILRTFIERQARHLQADELEQQVKPVFVEKIRQHLLRFGIQAVAGSLSFINELAADERFSISIATGGWEETAKLKLAAAGFATSELVIASASDHYSRKEIMRHSLSRAGFKQGDPLTYFGDAEWDVRACEELGVKLVIIGDKVPHPQSLENFSDTQQALEFILAD